MIDQPVQHYQVRRVQLVCHQSKFQTLPATGSKLLTADHVSAVACCSTM